MSDFSNISQNYERRMRELAETEANSLREALAKAHNEKWQAVQKAQDEKWEKTREVLNLQAQVRELSWKMEGSPWNKLMVERAEARAAEAESQNFSLRANAAIQAARLNQSFRDNNVLKAKVSELAEAHAEAMKEAYEWFIIADDAFDQFDERENTIRALIWENKFLREITTERSNELFEIREKQRWVGQFNEVCSRMDENIRVERQKEIKALKAEVESLRAALNNATSTEVVTEVVVATPARKVPGDKQRNAKRKAKARKGRLAQREAKSWRNND